MVRSFLDTWEVQNWIDVRKNCPAGTHDAAYIRAEDYGMRDGFTFGTCEFDANRTSCFFFGGRRVENTARTKTIIEVSVQHLSRSLMSLRKKQNAVRRFALTPRENEVLQWLKEGKTSWEISAILNISERCATFHVQNLKLKLGAVNRTQAVAIAIENRLIDL